MKKGTCPHLQTTRTIPCVSLERNKEGTQQIWDLIVLWCHPCAKDQECSLRNGLHTIHISHPNDKKQWHSKENWIHIIKACQIILNKLECSTRHDSICHEDIISSPKARMLPWKSLPTPPNPKSVPRDYPCHASAMSNHPYQGTLQKDNPSVMNKWCMREHSKSNIIIIHMHSIMKRHIP